MNYDVLFFTHTDINYEFFALPYAYFALRNNPSSLVEITVDDIERFNINYSLSISALQNLFPNRFLFRQCDNLSIRNPATFRFLQQPHLKAKYVYIGDIDLLVFDDVVSVHENLISEYSLPFSNMIRPKSIKDGKPRLTGLHFCEYNKYYPVSNLDFDTLNTQNDEHILYLLMKSKGYMVPKKFSQRPECGMHISMSRTAFGSCSGAKDRFKFDMNVALGWSLNDYQNVYSAQVNEPAYQSLRPLLDRRYKLLESIIEFVIAKDLHGLHFTAASFGIDRRLSFNEAGGKLEKKKFLSTIQTYLEKDDFYLAEYMVSSALHLWPFDIDIYELYFKVKITSGLAQHDVIKINQAVLSQEYANKILKIKSVNFFSNLDDLTIKGLREFDDEDVNKCLCGI